MKKRILSSMASLLWALVTLSSCSWTLFRDGKTSYTIVVSPDASTSEKTAAKELKDYLGQISGAEFRLTEDLSCKGRKIVVGYNDCTADAVGEMVIDDNDESFTYRSKGRDIYIYGGRQRGTMYGVFTFLENEFGCRWYTPDFTKVPEMDTWSFNELDHHESPAFKYRYSNYFHIDNATAWSAHNKKNMKWNTEDTEYGCFEAYWSCHTMVRTFVTDAEYYQTHPEYFAMRDGKRVRNEQLCLSNPEVLEICKKEMLKVMDEEPMYSIYSLSQNDTMEYCECDECKKLEEQYGGHSGIIVWFVNQVADAVKEAHPDKYIGTFAYQYSRKPPVGIKPRDNVVIRLCPIECCRAHPMEDRCPLNDEFMNDLEGWKELTPNIYMWDYIVDFENNPMAYPNYATLAPNLRTFRDHGVFGVFEQSQGESPCSEFDELRAWVITKLLWNPDQDTDALVKDFIEGYYGKAASKILEYYHLCQSIVTPDGHFTVFTSEDKPMYTNEFIKKGEELLAEAMAMAEDDTMRARIEKVQLQILYLKVKKNKYINKYPDALTDGTWDKVKEMLIRLKCKPNELTAEEFIKKMETEKPYL